MNFRQMSDNKNKNLIKFREGYEQGIFDATMNLHRKFDELFIELEIDRRNGNFSNCFYLLKENLFAITPLRKGDV